ncbi:serine/threonine-protein kinase [Saccharothrix xinjiangensis]|uniref:non-specific serine/threonine protein kinase n=1 Tax=Saccharothrix xinjiangensis TaxID=204798 RepID=A0ABV9YBB6_9PSEU
MTDEGRLVAGRYRVRARLGAGAMGVVWRAFDERLGREVALKQLVVPEGVDAVEAAARAAREGRIAARLHHPNAITVHDVVEEAGRPVLVMEYLPSRSLAEVGVLEPGAAARVVAQVASALAAAHAAGIVHRDVKPGNVLIAADGTAKISDFGIARAVGDVAVTRTGLLAGTPAFLAPEVARGGEPGPASDVFSLGATLYAAVEGRPPFGDGVNAIALLHTVASGRFAPPAHAGPLTGLLMDMLRTEPHSRPTMAQVAERLRGGPPAHTPPPQVPLPQTRLDLAPAPPGRRGRLLPVALVALTVVGAVVAVVVATSGDDGDRVAAPTSGVTTGSATAGSATAGSAPATTTTAPAVELERAVADYYALLPEHVDEAWEMLGPGARAQGRPGFEKAWRDVEDLTVVATPVLSGPGAVTLAIGYTKGSHRVTETRRHRVVVRDGTPLIESDEVLLSEREDRKKRHRDEEKDEGDG